MKERSAACLGRRYNEVHAEVDPVRFRIGVSIALDAAAAASPG